MIFFSQFYLFMIIQKCLATTNNNNCMEWIFTIDECPVKFPKMNSNTIPYNIVKIQLRFIYMMCLQMR